MLTSLEMIDSPRLAREEWRGERGWILPGAAASCRPAMAPPQCHFTSDGAPSPSPTHPHRDPHLLSPSKLLQSAEALIGLGQVSAIHFNHGGQNMPDHPLCIRVWLCGGRNREGGRMICALQPYYKLQINIFSHLPGCNHADSLGFYMLGLHFVFHTNTAENTTEVALRNNSLSCWDCVPQLANMLTVKSDVYHVHHLSSLCYPANIWWLALKTKCGCCK